MKKVSFFLLIFIFLPSLFLVAVDEEAELGPGVAQKVNQQDAPLDHAATKDAAQEAVKQSGAGDPLKKTEPVKDQWFQSGKFPRDTYIYNVGKDGKIYGKGQKPPKGSKQKLAIRLIQFEDGWVGTAEIVHEEGDDFVTDGLANSGMGEADKLSSDQTSDSVATAKRNAERMDKFKAKDPLTAARQALVKLQMKGKLYDPSKEIEETSGKREKSSSQERLKESTKKEKAPERQAHPVHGSSNRQAHHVHGSLNQGFGDEFAAMGSGTKSLGSDAQSSDHDTAPDAPKCH